VNGHGKTDRLAAQALPLPSLLPAPLGQELYNHNEEGITTNLDTGAPKRFDSDSSNPIGDCLYSLCGRPHLLVRMQRLIREHFNVSIPRRELLSTSALREMASSVHTATTVSTIYWQNKMALDSISRGGKDLDLTARVKSDGVTVVMTGATLYL
jgi:hybrid polyketide synthase/nonribosomal peptide synthetase ACE1